jgi:hypothetical protein
VQVFGIWNLLFIEEGISGKNCICGKNANAAGTVAGGFVESKCGIELIKTEKPPV